MTKAKKARLTLGLNIEEMSRLVGVHRQTWAKWEHGERNLTAAPSRLLDVILWMHSRGLIGDFLRDFRKKTP